MSHKEVRYIKQTGVKQGKMTTAASSIKGGLFLPTTISSAPMANLPTQAQANAADASGFKLFGQVIQPDAHRAASASTSTEESTPPPPPPPPPPQPTTPVQAAAGGEALPCPRCGSRETKFCYFNNYNVRQPRHLCRACRRYWTAGGALRRVASASPGRRRPRPSARSVAAAATASASEEGAAESVDSRS